GAEELSRALCAGFDEPAGLHAQVMQRIAQAPREVIAASRRMAAGKSVSSSWFVAAGLAATVAGAGVYHFATPSRTAPTAHSPEVAAPQTSPSSMATPPKPAHIPLSRTWDFNKPEALQDLRVSNGSWHFVPKGGPAGLGCME